MAKLINSVYVPGQRLVDEKYICHASGNRSHRFIHGFYLYYIVPEKERGGGLSTLSVVSWKIVI